MENDRADAAAQLAALDADRAAMADRAMQPWWYDVALGLLVFQLIASYSVHETWAMVAAAVLLLAGVAALAAAYQRITGTWWDARTVGPVQGPVRRAMRWWLAGYLTVLVLGCAAEYLLDVRGAMVVAGAVLGLTAALLSRWVARTYVAGLRREL